MTTPRWNPIAIVGRGCALPGALSPEELWALVAAGNVALENARPEDWRVDSVEAHLATPSEEAAERAWSARGGYVRGFEERFDAGGFAIDARLIERLDPMVRWCLWSARQACEGARIKGYRGRAAVILGNLSYPSPSMARRAEATWYDEEDEAIAPEAFYHSGLPAHLVARALGWSGGSFALDAACASSLYALGLACDRLRDGRADLALAGGVNHADDLFLHVGFSALRALSPSGRSRPFHREADGLIPAAGAGFLLLKRLEDAERDGDPIYGLIRGAGFSNDGRGKGVLTPSRDGQRRAMRAAYEAAGVAPATVSWIECHATGTPLGDATELRSMADIFEGAPGVAIGSLKSNLGHLITASGVAGIIRVLEAMRRGTLPPEPNIEEPIPWLAEETPFELVREARAWETAGPRRAGVNNFGFGGNNAHVILEEYAPSQASASPGAEEGEPPEIAIVGVAAIVGDRSTRSAWEASLRDGTAIGRAIGPLGFGVRELRFPPADLERALPQQLAILRAAADLSPRVTGLDPERVGVWVGMGCDAQTARYGVRWRERSLGRGERDRIAPALASAGVIGTMPNMVANRIQAHFDLRAPGYAVSAEQASGLAALEIARRALGRGQIDAALVGAVEMGHAPAARAAAERVLGRPADDGADAAVVLLVKRLSDAERDGDPIYAVLESEGLGEADFALGQRSGATSLLPRSGYAHAADGLLHLAAGALCCARHLILGEGMSAARPWRAEGARRVAIAYDALGGESYDYTLRAPIRPLEEGADPVPPRSAAVTFDARWPEMPELPSRAQKEGAAIIPSAPSLAPTLGDLSALALPPLTRSAQPTRSVAPQAIETDAIASPRPPSPPLGAASVGPSSLGLTADSAASIAARLFDQVSEVHLDFVAHAAQAQASFLRALSRDEEAPPRRAPRPSLEVLASSQATEPRAARADVGVIASAPSAQPVRERVEDPTRALRAPATARVRGVEEPRGARRQEGGADRAATLVRDDGVARVVGAVGGRGGHAIVPSSAKPDPIGPTYERDAIAIHASGKISDVFGPLFARQDDWTLQVRMPEPPLLLCDRVTGIDCEPGVVGTGTLWCESEIPHDAWYLHEGRMPVGIMIESGQADLMLISYMGADFENQGTRAYRLLGCDLMFHGSLARPGDVLRYDIHIDGHARQGPVRLFFFHYDLEIDAQVRLSVRNGQAGFFTYQELAESNGILWRPEDEDRAAIEGKPWVEPPRACQARSFGAEAVQAFAEGAAWRAFGAGFERTASHTATPRIQADRMRFFETVDAFDPSGGPYERGYLRATQPVRPDDWFFPGHFKNDPCMPGTLMFEGCVQAMAFYLAACGWTVERDGWVFEPVPEMNYELRCRGQVTPESREVTYEVFVREVHGGPEPTLFADLLCTVDGLKAFHCRNMGLRLVPAWPLDRRDALSWSSPEAPSAQPPAVVDGFAYDFDSLMACAWGRPTRAFGPMYEPFDSARRVARLPGPPYHFVSRIVELDPAARGAHRADTSVVAEYDLPPDAWYFDAQGARVMPLAVLMEVGLQPCGWLASYVGCALQVPHDLSFRNLDGTATQHLEVLPSDKILRTRTTLKTLARAGGNTIVAFDVEVRSDRGLVLTMDTVFGFFPTEALAAQAGLGTGDEAWALEPAETIEVIDDDSVFCAGSARLPAASLRMFGEVDGYWPGEAPRYRATKIVSPDDWYFQAHFYSDPVQPGSLGIEGLIQLLQFAMLHQGMAEGMGAPRFVALELDQAMTWRYRGQVLPENAETRFTIEVLESGRDGLGAWARGRGSVWVDGTRIYHASSIGMRIVDGPAQVGTQATVGKREARSEDAGARAKSVDELTWTLDPDRDAWLADHAPTYTDPALPITYLADRIAALAARLEPGRVVAGLEGVEVDRWVTVRGPTTLRARLVARRGDRLDVALEVWRDAARAELSRFEEVARGTALLADAYPEVEAGESFDLSEAVALEDPYGAGGLFHGPAFRHAHSIERGPRGARARLDARSLGVPVGAIHPSLVDAILHAIPHDQMELWWPAGGAGRVAYPRRVERLTFHRPAPEAGSVSVEARLERAESSVVTCHIEARLGDELWASMRLTEALMPKGPLGELEPSARRAFLGERRAIEAEAMGRVVDGALEVSVGDVARSNWFPGALAQVYGIEPGPIDAMARSIARKEGAAALLASHPSAIMLGEKEARVEGLSIARASQSLEASDGMVRVRTEPARPDIEAITRWWTEQLEVDEAWPGVPVYGAMLDRYVRSIRFEDAAALAALGGRPALFLGNHEVQVESLLITILASALLGRVCVTVANAKHERGWVGRLIRSLFAYPGARDPRNIIYFDRSDPGSMLELLGGLAERVRSERVSVMLHAPGTRAIRAGVEVEQVSSALIDFALDLDLPIVPLAFAGGLPVEPLSQGAKLEFPYGQAGQDYAFGVPIEPAHLRGLPYAARRHHVLDAINALIDSSRGPNPPLVARDEAIRAAIARGEDEVSATLADLLRDRPAIARALLGSMLNA